MADVKIVSVEAVRRFRFERQSLDGSAAEAPVVGDAPILDYGVQDTGPDGAAWALLIRGADVPAADLVYAWTLRGAPHAYRRADIAAIAVATAPLSEADAGKRIFDAMKPLKAAGIPALDALRTLAGHQRTIVRSATVKGEVSSRLTQLVDEPYLRSCKPCNAIHVYENPFRMAALQAALELERGTSPPVLRRITGLKPPMYRRLGVEAEPRFDVVRNYVRFFGPARIRDAAAYLDAPQADVERQWPADVVEVTVEGEAAPAPASTSSGRGSSGRGSSGRGSSSSSSGRARRRFVLAEDAEALAEAGAGRGTTASASVRLLGPFDPYLQLRDRELLAPEPERRKALWPILGRPGAVVRGGEVLALWRPRTSGKRLRLAVEPWRSLRAADRRTLEEDAERLAAFRDVMLAGLDFD
ncbi:MAG TPA: crosslink repair DNA glycosylase YcaQ family protein [Acidimicrobiia bacterium]|nr:crosslink repair DNA glycosylase YcaQ family protein [Acidimicrobiia bacterium]